MSVMMGTRVGSPATHPMNPAVSQAACAGSLFWTSITTFVASVAHLSSPERLIICDSAVVKVFGSMSGVPKKPLTNISTEKSRAALFDLSVALNCKYWPAENVKSVPSCGNLNN